MIESTVQVVVTVKSSRVTCDESAAPLITLAKDGRQNQSPAAGNFFL